MRTRFRKILFLFLLLLFSIGLVSCLTCERKEYVFQLTGAGKGRLTIRYVNIFSNSIDSTAELDRDYDELITMWLKGEKLERDFPGAKRFKKRLYEQDGMLNGEVTMEFDDISKVRMYRYKGTGPYMFSMSAVNDDGENFLQSNGEFGGDRMPVIFWPDDAQTLRFSTKVAQPDSSTVSMLDMWRKNQK